MNITNAATATKRDIEVMKKYFDNGTASIGSLCRKLPFLLLDLVGNSIDDYSLIVTYDAQNKNFLTKISTDLEEKFRIDNSVTKQGVNEANSLKILRKMFEKDKFVKTPCSYAQVQIEYNHGVYIYEKSKVVISADLTKFIFKISNKTSLFKRMLNVFLPDDRHVGNTEILKTVLPNA